MSVHFQDKQQYWSNTANFSTPDFNAPIEGVSLGRLEHLWYSKDGMTLLSCSKKTQILMLCGFV